MRSFIAGILVMLGVLFALSGCSESPVAAQSVEVATTPQSEPTGPSQEDLEVCIKALNAADEHIGLYDSISAVYADTLLYAVLAVESATNWDPAGIDTATDGIVRNTDRVDDLFTQIDNLDYYRLSQQCRSVIQ